MISSVYDSFCAYRYPSSNDIFILKGYATKGFHPGFVIAPFDLESNGFMTIESLCACSWTECRALLDNDNPMSHIYPMPANSTSKEEHEKEVAGIIRELSGNPGKKTIAARAICSEGLIDYEKTFLGLCAALPESFTFFFYTPCSGAWIGASPELLLNSCAGRLHTYALAGTKPTLAEWDVKNMKEQDIVLDYIVNCFKNWNLDPECSETITLRTGKVEHLLTEISAEAPVSDFDMLSFLIDYSPTPALCGYPKIESLDRISRLEKFKRGYYGGFCGPFESPDKFTFYVNLRSIRFDSRKWCMFAGGGITSRSCPHDEWIETERKADGIINNLYFLSQS